jgi:hypothetical protein
MSIMVRTRPTGACSGWKQLRGALVRERTPTKVTWALEHNFLTSVSLIMPEKVIVSPKLPRLPSHILLLKIRSRIYQNSDSKSCMCMNEGKWNNKCKFSLLQSDSSTARNGAYKQYEPSLGFQCLLGRGNTKLSLCFQLSTTPRKHIGGVEV